MHIEFSKGALLQAMITRGQLFNEKIINIREIMINSVDKRKCLRKTITALTNDGYIIPQSTFGSTYTLNFERINQIKF